MGCVVSWGLDRSKGNKASSCDQFVHMESSLLGYIFLEAMNKV